MKAITIVDYGMANLRSVQKAFEKLGHAAIITGDADRVAEAHQLVLPGVGAFRDAIQRLRESGVATETDYPTPFASAIWRDNVFATQFHPEKSQRVGLQILHKFAGLR